MLRLKKFSIVSSVAALIFGIGGCTKDAPSVDTKPFDPVALAKSSSDICDYVSKAYDLGKEEQISSPKGKATANGKTVTFISGWDGGSCGTSEIQAEGYEGSENRSKSEELLRPFHFASEPWDCGWRIMVVPFQGKYYTVSSMLGIPGEVVDPNAGKVCGFKEHYQPTLVENKSPKICERFFKGELKHNVEWEELDKDEIETTDTDLGIGNGASFDRSANISLDGKKRARIGHFNYLMTGGSGCSWGGVAVLSKDKMLSDKKEPNKSLIDSQVNKSTNSNDKWEQCQGADADLIRVDGITYVDTWGGKIGDRENPPHALLQLINGSFQPICQIDQVLSVTPTAPTSH